MKPRLNQTVHFAKVKEGVFFKGWNTSFILKGHSSLYPFIEKLVPFLDGNHTLDQICGDVPHKYQKLVKTVIGHLESHGMVRDSSQDLTHHLSEKEQQTYYSVLSFLADRMDSPAYSFERYRNAKLLLVGEGRSLYTCIRALVSMGLKSVRLHTGNILDNGWREKIERLMANRKNGDPMMELEKVSSLEKTDAPSLILFVQDVFHPDECAFWHAYAKKNRIPILCGSFLRGYGLLGPFYDGENDLDFFSAAVRIQDAHPDWKTASGANHAVLGVAGNYLAYETFKYFTGCMPMETLGHAVVVDPDTLESNRHRMFIDRRASPRPDDANEIIRIMNDYRNVRANMSFQQYVDQAGILSHPHFGIVTDWGPADLVQVPLNVSRTVLVRDGPDHIEEEIMGTGLHLDHSLDLTMGKALERYVARRIGRTGMRGRQALRLFTDELHECNANDYVVAIGHGYEEWIADGIQKLCAKEISSMPNRMVYRQWDSNWIKDPESQYYLKTIRAYYDKQIRMIEATHMDLPSVKIMYAVERESQWGMAIGRSEGETIRLALFQAVSNLQLHRSPALCQPADNLGLSADGRSDLGGHETPIEWGDWNWRVNEEFKRMNKVIWIVPFTEDLSVKQAGFLAGVIGIEG